MTPRARDVSCLWTRPRPERVNVALDPRDARKRFFSLRALWRAQIPSNAPWSMYSKPDLKKVGIGIPVDYREFREKSSLPTGRDELWSARFLAHLVRSYGTVLARVFEAVIESRSHHFGSCCPAPWSSFQCHGRTEIERRGLDPVSCATAGSQAPSTSHETS